ncbi:MAG: lipase chaperone LimK [Oceanicoccus sp.]|jgi:lipase chaperone LimK
MLKPIIAAIACLIVILVWWFKPEVTLSQAETSVNPEYVSSSVDLNNHESIAHTDNTLPEFLSDSSLKGTSIDGLYPVDENGNLLLSGSIKHRFEYFLSTMGEFSLEQVQQMIRDDIESNLQEPARSQALQLFEDYVGYKYALADLEQSLQAPQDYEINDIERMRLQLQQLRDKRREYFSQEAVDAFFGFDELYDDFMLNRLEIQASSQLSPAEKAAQIQSLEQNLPEQVRSMRDETQRISQVFEITQDMRDEGASEDDIFERNSQEFGQEAAERLRVLDSKRQAFQQKVDRYMTQQKSIVEDEALTETDKQIKLDELLTSFDADERRRLKAFQLMNQEQSTTEQ